MSNHSDHDDYDEEMGSSGSYGEENSLEFTDSEGEGIDDVHQMRSNFLEHLRSSSDPHARQLAQVFQAVMPGFEPAEEEEEGDDNLGSADNELGPLLAHLRNMTRRMFHPVTGPLAGRENDLLDDGDDDIVRISGPMRNVSKVRLVRIALTLTNNSKNDGIITHTLHQLNEVILLTEQDEFGAIVPIELVNILIKILDDSESSPMILVLVTRAIAHMLEANDPTVVKMFVESKLLDAIKVRIADLNYIDVAEQAVTALDRVVQRYPGEVMASGCVQNLLSYSDFFNVHLQRSIASIVYACAAGINDSRFDDVLNLLTALTPDPVIAKGDPVADTTILAYAQLFISMEKNIEGRDRLQTFFNEDYSGTALETFMLSTTHTAPHIGRILKAMAAITSLRNSAAKHLFKANIASRVAGSLGEVDFSEPVDPQQTLPKFLNTPKENIAAALGLFTTMLPYPSKLEDNLVSPFRREPKNTPDLSGIDEDLLALHGSVVTRLSASLYAASTDSVLREQILRVMLQICAYLQGDVFEAVVNAIDYPTFLASVLSQVDAPIPLVVGALEIVYEVGKKLPHKYLAEFNRRGIINDLDGAKSNKAYHEHKFSPALAAVIDRVRNLYSEFPEYSQNNDGAEASDLTKALLQGEDKYDELARVIREYASLELMKFGVFEAVIKLLNTASSRETAIEGLGPVISILVAKSQDALSHGDRLGLLSSSSSSTVQSFASALTRPVNIRLRAPDHDRAWTLRVQGIASIEAVEDFYRSRVPANYSRTRRNNLFSLLDDNAGATAPTERESWQDFGDDPDFDYGVDQTDDDDSDRYDLDIDFEEGNDDDEEEEEEGELSEITEAGPAPQSQSSWAGAANAVEVNHGAQTEHTNEQRASSTDRRWRHAQNPLDEADDWRDSASDSTEKPKVFCYLNGQRVYSDMSVVGAIYRSFPPVEGDNVIPKTLWTDTFDIIVSKKRLPETKREGSTYLGRGRSIEAESVGQNEIPASLRENNYFSVALKLLALLWVINGERSFCHPRRFVNSILTAKLNRQLEDPLVVVSSILPQWTVDAVRLYPFLFPFETRYMFIQSTSFGYSRCMSRWQTRGDTGEISDLGPQGALSPFQATAQAIARTGVLNNAGRPVKYKVNVPRQDLFANFVEVLHMIGNSPAILEVEFTDEAGTGLGPTQEFYAKVSQEFASVSLDLWLGEDVNGFLHHNQGLFPKPIADFTRKVFEFRNLGRFISRAFMDQRILDFRFNPAFFLAVLKSQGFLQSTTLTLKDVDSDLYDNLQKLDKETVESLELTFVLPGDEDVEICADGKQKLVTADNLDEYKQRVESFMLEDGVKFQIDQFVTGFSENLPIASLQALLPVEICRMCGQSDEDWSVETLSCSIHVDHGYSSDSPAVQNLILVMSALTLEERRAFLQFTTGSPNLPIGGFKALQPPFTVVLKHPEDEKIDRDQYLPSVMTCANYLKLPNYSSRAIMARQIRVAVEEGSDSFQLS